LSSILVTAIGIGNENVRMSVNMVTTIRLE
jgi:hypothetical protein